MSEVDTAPRTAELRRVPWGANIVRQASGDPYVKSYEIVEGESASQAMTKAGLDWEVELKPACVSDADGYFVERPIPNYWAPCRSDNGLPLSIVGGRYTPFQNMEQAAFVDALVDTSASTHVGAGELDEGRKVYSLVKLDKEIRPGGIPEEVIDIYLLATNHHTGLASFQASVFPLREFCTNGMRFTIRGFASTWKVRHTRGMAERVHEAQQALSLSMSYADQFELEVEALLDQRVTEIEFNKIVENLFPLPADPEERKRLNTMQTERRFQLAEIYHDSPDLQNIRGTGFGVVNAVAEWEQWVNPSFVLKRYQTREFALLNRITSETGGVNELSNRARELVRAI